MPEARLEAPGWLLRWEGWIVCVACAAALVGIPVALGQIGLSWDALNHHIYLGWTAEQTRFDRDYLAASYQAYQFPFLYWPAYRLALGGAPGWLAGAVLAAMHLTVLPALWWIARLLVPGTEWADALMRAIAVVLALMSGVVLSMFDTTGNDLLAAIPVVWAIAFALAPIARSGSAPAARRSVLASGLLAGIGTAFKLSNAPIVIVLPLLWVWGPGPLAQRAMRLVAGTALAAVGFVLTYGVWGWQLWSHFGNPFYPLFDHWFEPLRLLTGWRR